MILKKFFLIVGVVLIVAIPLWVRYQRSARNLEMAAAIQHSALFSNAVTLEASASTSLSREPVSLEALTLRDAGLLTIDSVSTAPLASPEPSPPLIRTIRRTYLARLRDAPVPRLVPTDTAVTRDWQAFEDPERQRQGWIIPVGARELTEITSIEEVSAETVQVQFKWNWKPNEVGRHFDITQPTGRPDPPWKRKSNPVLSTAFPFNATAELSRIGNKWEVKSIKWNFEAPRKAS